MLILGGINLKYVTALFIVIFLCVNATPTMAIIESDAVYMVVNGKVHAEKCKADHPSMQAEIDAAVSLWNQRNQKYITAAESRADFKEIEIETRARFNNKGSLSVSDCQFLIQRAKSPESDIDLDYDPEFPKKRNDDNPSLPLGSVIIPKETGLSDIWKDLQPYSKIDIPRTELIKILSFEQHRKASMSFVEEMLKNRQLNLEDQFRLGLIVRILQQIATENEYSKICYLIDSGKIHKTFCAITHLYFPPPFFLCAIEILKEPSFVAPLFNPDGGQISEIDIIPMVIHVLKMNTGKDFGHNYGKWKEWWLREGQYLEYDKTLQKYK